MSEDSTSLLEARFNACVVESSDDAIFGLSLQGLIQSWNPAAVRLFGCSAEQAVGRHMSFLTPAERLTEDKSVFTRLTSGERVDPYDTVRLRNDGQQVRVSLSLSALKDAQGRVVMVCAIARHSGRKAFEDHSSLGEAEFRATFEQSAVAMAQVSARSGRFIRVNATY